MCCDAWEFAENEKVDGVCPDCGSETIDGCSTEHCNYSTVLCETCGNSPCDGSC